MFGKVSVVVPIYKCENYIGKCIESIIAQSYSNIEIILVLDGVFDRSDEICRKYAENDKRIRIIEKDNEGVSIARNVGIENSSGCWIAFVDSDDWLDYRYIEKLVESASTGTDIVICDYYAEYASQSLQEKFFNSGDCIFNQKDKETIITNCMLPMGIGNTGGCTNVGVPWGKLYRTGFIKDNELIFKPGLNRMQDMVFNLYAFSKAGKIVYKSIPLYHYLKNKTSSTIAFRPDFSKTVIAINEAVEEFISVSGLSFMHRILSAKNILLIMEIVKLQYVMDFGKSKKEKIHSIRLLLREELFQKSIKNYDAKLLNKKMRVAGILLKWDCVELIYAYVEKKNRKLISKFTK